MIEKSVRNLLLAIGISRTQAAMVTPNMYQAPAVSDPKSPHIMMVVAALQDCLVSMGYRLARTGYLDVPTANAMTSVVGEGWERMTWADNIAAVLAQKRTGAAMSAAANGRASTPAVDVSLSGLSGMGGMPLGLPDVPGGLVTYGVAAFFVYRHFKKKRG